MEKKSDRQQSIYMAVLAGAGWFALLLQFYLIVSNAAVNGFPLFGAVIKFFSYFTILTNILVAWSLTACLLKPQSTFGKFFSRSSVKAAIADYIIIVGLVYNIILSKLWDPQGLQLVADVLLHQAIPVLYVLYWLVFVPKGYTKWTQIFRWLIYPFIYLLYILVRGGYTGHFPYPFLDVNQLGIERVAQYCGIIMAGFIAVGILLLIAERLMKKQKK